VKKPNFSFERRGELALVVMRGGIDCCRCLFATQLYLTLFRDLNPDSVMFVNIDPVTGRVALDELRWSDRLWSYIYLDSVALSSELAAALGLEQIHWQHGVTRPLLAQG
jgi:hypothetical protein